MKKSIVFIGIIFLLLLGTTVVLAAVEEVAVKATVENDRIYIGDKTKVGFTAVFTDPQNPDMNITLDSYNFANSGFISLSSDCFTVRYSSSNSNIAAVDDKRVVTGISAGSATITQEIAFNLEFFDAGMLTETLISDLNGCEESSWEYVGLQRNFATIFRVHERDTFTRKVTITVVPDDRLYLCQKGEEPVPVKITMNAASVDTDRLCVGTKLNVDFAVTLTELNDPAAKYSFNKFGFSWGTALDPENLTVEYSSDNESVATVNKQGVVTGVSEGWANITVNLIFKPENLDQAGLKDKIRKARLALKPSNTVQPIIFTRRVSVLVHPSIVMNNLILPQSGSGQLTVAIPPDFDKDLLENSGSWTISDPSIAEADPVTGAITGLRPGSTYAVYFLQVRKLSDLYIPITSGVTVYPVMAIHPEIIKAYIGTPTPLKVSFDPFYYGEKAGTWSVADESIASVDQSGKVTGIKTGKTTATFTITATVAQTDCTVVVAEPPFIIEPDQLRIYNGDTENLTVTYDSGYTGGKTGTWSVADGTIVSVEDNSTPAIRINRRHTIPGTVGAKVTGLKPGTTTVTFTDTATGARRDCTVMVKPSFTITPDPLTVYEGETGGLAVSFDNGYNGSRDGRWTVDDNTVASIDQNGVVTGIKAGTAIAAYAADPTPTASVALDGIARIIQATAIANPAENIVRTVSVVVKPGTFTVTFDPNGGGPTPSSVYVKHDTAVTRPDDPSLRGMNFIGWYTELSGGTKWDFTNDKVTEDMTLYAQWREEKLPSIPLNRAPTITGPDTISLMESYDSIDQAYIFSGNPAPTYGISPTEPNTANATFDGDTLTIPEGLTEEGSPYSVTLFATNSSGTTTKTVTVNVYPVITINFVTEIEFFLSSNDNKIIASGGAGEPYTFSLAPGSSMPDGLSLNSDGTITGTAATGLYDPVTVTVADRLGNYITRTGLAVRVSD